MSLFLPVTRSIWSCSRSQREHWRKVRDISPLSHFPCLLNPLTFILPSTDCQRQKPSRQRLRRLTFSLVFAFFFSSLYLPSHFSLDSFASIGRLVNKRVWHLLFQFPLESWHQANAILVSVFDLRKICFFWVLER